jgi:excinuclease ABC subunit A
MLKFITIKGASQHNLKNINVKIPRNKLIVITGPSGSGKSSLAFDTLYAEGQRRYVESLSSYARQFLDRLTKPDVEHIEGLSPAIAIEQRLAGSNPRSTVATTTEIYDYLRLLFAHIGHPHCPKCSKPISSQSAQAITEKIKNDYTDGTKIMILAPYVSGRKGEHREVFEKIISDGFVRVRVDGDLYSVEDIPKLEKKFKHSIDAVVDRLIAGKTDSSRLSDSVETALKFGNGSISILAYNHEYGRTPDEPEWFEEKMSEDLACVDCGISFPELAPRNFSFNSHYGACHECHGIGSKLVFDEKLLIPEPSLSLSKKAIPALKRGPRHLIIYYNHLLKSVAKHYGNERFFNIPFNDIPEKIKKIFLYGSGKEIVPVTIRIRGKMHTIEKPFEGIIPHLERRYRETESESVRDRLSKLMVPTLCPACKGKRLRPEILAVTIGLKEPLSIDRFNALTVEKSYEYISTLKSQISDEEYLIASEIIREITCRLGFLRDVGLNYLSLDRTSGSLSGGESQRIRLATQIGSGLTGVLYILDEPSIGLHQRDNEKLLNTLESLKNAGNTVIVVEHDLETIERADFVLDLGPAAGKHGGEIVAQGSPKQIAASERSLTGNYLSGSKAIKIPDKRKQPEDFIILKGAAQNNLKNINVKIPLGLFCCITGVSGSGKSTLINDTLRPAIYKHLGLKTSKPGKFNSIKGLEKISKAIVIDQSPIGRTPRSNPATYTDTFTLIRELFSKVKESKIRGYKPGRFSFNVKGGRCEACKGDGVKKIEMQFLPDVFVTCSECGGKRFNSETLTIKYKGRNIADVLDMTVNEATDFFSAIPRIHRKLKTLQDVGLGYIHLGQQATTLSGGEAQRVKLAAELAKIPRGHTLYILDEPTTGLHIHDVNKLMDVIFMLRNKGNSVLIIEHNLDLIKACDYIIDLGPDGGEAGGEIVAVGSPEKIAENSNSHTGGFLKKCLNKKN